MQSLAADPRALGGDEPRSKPPLRGASGLATHLRQLAGSRCRIWGALRESLPYPESVHKA